jgi:hypothetical protein
VRKWELEVLGEELLDVWALDVLGLLELNNLEDLQNVLGSNRFGSTWRGTNVDGTEARSVSGSHILVQGLNGIGPGHLPVLLVHVVGAGAGIVTDPDAEVLDLERALLVDLIFISDMSNTEPIFWYIPRSS